MSGDFIPTPEEAIKRIEESEGTIAVKIEKSGVFTPETAYLYESGRSEESGTLALLRIHSEKGVSHEVVGTGIEPAEVIGLLDDGSVYTMYFQDVPFEKHGEKEMEHTEGENQR